MGSIDDTVSEIKGIKVQGARHIAIAGLESLRKIAVKDGFGREFAKACSMLESARPTAVALHNALEDVKKAKRVEEIDRMLYYFENVASVIASQNYGIVKDGQTILTHCHSSAVVELLVKAWEKGAKFRVIATETRPLLQGRTTAKELSEAGVPVVYTDDVSPGHIWQMHKRKISMLILGIDSIRREGIVNKVGSYLLAVFAKENMIPVYFVGEILKIDKRRKIFIEERNSEEIISQRALPGVKIENPAFDITPWKYVTGVLTEKGVLNPRRILEMFR
jgi:ribose 1,5-bisphosphate isomerase